MGEDGRTAASNMLVEPDAKPSFGQHHFQRGVAALQRITPQIVASSIRSNA
jgi:hypothetical protein